MQARALSGTQLPAMAPAPHSAFKRASWLPSMVPASVSTMVGLPWVPPALVPPSLPSAILPALLPLAPQPPASSQAKLNSRPPIAYRFDVLITDPSQTLQRRFKALHSAAAIALAR